MNHKIKYQDYDCYVELNKYLSTGNNAIYLKEIGTNDDIAIATANLHGVRLNKDEVAIKDYSENEGMLKTLVKAKIVSVPISFVQTGFVICPICKLLITE